MTFPIPNCASETGPSQLRPSALIAPNIGVGSGLRRAQALQECFGVEEVGGGKAFGVGAVESLEETVGGFGAALPLPEPGEAHGGA